MNKKNLIIFVACMISIILTSLQSYAKDTTIQRTQSIHYLYPDLAGWPKEMAGSLDSAVVGDIDKDGDNEIAIVMNDPDWHNNRCYLYVFKKDGSVIPGWPQELEGTENFSSPVLGNLDSDEQSEIVVGTGNKIYAFNHDGTILSGWPVIATVRHINIADINKDGQNEIICSAYGQGLCVYRSNGEFLEGWPRDLGTGYPPAYEPTFSAVVGNLDQDDELEIVVGTGKIEVPGPARDGYVHVLKANGEYMTGWPKYFDRPIRTSPVLADVDHDGSLEIITGGANRDQWTTDGEIYILKNNGTAVNNWPQQTEKWPREISIGDINSDGELEIVTILKFGNIYAYDINGNILPNWPPQDVDINSDYAVTIANIDDDANLEILASGDNLVNAFKADASQVIGWPKQGSASMQTPVISDIDGDGRLEIIASGGWVSSGDCAIYVWKTIGSCRINAPWPTFKHDNYRTGLQKGKAPLLQDIHQTFNKY